MALPPLDHFLSTVPAYDLATVLGEIIQSLGQPEAGAPSHILVTDDEYRPLGAIALGRLWASYYAWGQSHPESTPDQLRLSDCQLWLEPVVEVMANQLLAVPALAELGALAQQNPAPTLVIIDADGCYLGVINPTRLIGCLAANLGGTREISETEPDWRGAGQRAWVLELSHALKTPITTLLGLSTLLLDSRVGSLSDRQFRYVSLMRQSIRKLTGLVNLLLDWMRLESDQIALNLERVSLQPLLDELLPSFLNAQPEAATSSWAKDFAIRLGIPAGWVMADPLRLRQSLHYSLGYLLAQGIEPGGLVVEPWGPWLGFTLWGEGEMPMTALGTEAGAATTLSSAELNTAPDSSPSDASGRTIYAEPATKTLQGLGLTLARQFSQLHGGEISSFSTSSWGSRLTLLLPAPAAVSSTTVVVLLAGTSEVVLDQVYGCLRGSLYRLAIAPSAQTLRTMQARLKPTCTLIHWESLPDAPTNTAARQALVEWLGIAQPVVLQSAGVRTVAAAGAPSWATAQPGSKTLAVETLAQGLRPTLDQICQQPPVPMAGLTMLLLRPSGAGDTPSALSTSVQTWLQRYRCRLLQVDNLDQANLLSRVWQPQAIVLDSTEPVTLAELEALAQFSALARLPVVTLVPSAVGDAGSRLGLTVVLCSDVLSQPPAEAVRSIMQAIAAHQPSDSAASQF